MVRPATPLTVLLFAAFILLLLSVISTPIVKSIPLGSFEGYDFGVFGFCARSKCSGAEIGYSTNALDDGEANDSDFRLSSNTRSSLSSILIVHPIAALLTLVCLVLAGSVHLHSPSHSPRYLLALLILLLPTLLITLLAFLVDILLFVPHLAWGGWIVLVSTILIVASGILTCAMRRTLVSRKAQKRRIAENAEMNGENYRNSQNVALAESPPPLTTNSTPPTVNGGPGSDKLPAFATYDMNASTMTDDERMPLNTRTPSNKTLPSNGLRTKPSNEMYERYTGSGRGAPGGMRGGRGGPFNGPRDEIGNPLPPSNAFGPMPHGEFRREPMEPPVMRQYSNDSANSQGFRGKGRGGYPSRGYGRGSFSAPGRGGTGSGGNGRGVPIGADPGMMTGEIRNRRQEPPPVYGNQNPPQRRAMPAHYNDDMRPGPVMAQMYGEEPSAPGYARRPSPGPPSAPGGYGRRPSPGPPSAPGGYTRQRSPGQMSEPGANGHVSRDRSPGPGQQPYRAHSPPPPMPEPHSDETHMIGQAIEMDAYTGNPSPTPTMRRPVQPFGNNGDVDRPIGFSRQQEDTRGSSVYSDEQLYISPRAAWTGGPARNGTPPYNPSKTLSPIDPSPIELPNHQSPNPRPQSQISSHRRKQSSDTYYEDVDPRFAEPLPSQSPPPMPNSLIPGNILPPHPHPLPQPSYPPNRKASPSPSRSYDSIQDGARSPTTTISDTSNFTSISQRAVNPHWAPPPPGVGIGGVPNRRPHHQPNDILLQTNPDFELPSPGGAGRSRNKGLMSGMGPAGGGRYPIAEG